MNLTGIYREAMRQSREGVPDRFELANDTGLHFPCSICEHGEGPLSDGPCEGCCHFIV